MSSVKALGLVVRTADWSESSRVATLWTRELGKVRVLAKGGRRLRSNFETALDLLTLCSIVLHRKSSSSLDLLTEAQVVQRYPGLTTRLPALYAGYYVAELLADWTEDYDPHPGLFEEARATLDRLCDPTIAPEFHVARYEWVLLGELGYRPVLDHCVLCQRPKTQKASPVAFSVAAGGVLCPLCRTLQRPVRRLSAGAWHALRGLEEGPVRSEWEPAVRTQVRQLLNDYVTHWMGRRPRLLPYLGS